MDVEKLIEELQAALDKALKGGGNKARIDAAKKELANIRTSNKLTTEEIKNRNKALLAARELVKKDVVLKSKIDDRIRSNDKLIKQNEEYVETIRKVGSAFVGLGKAAYRGSGSISDFTDNIYGLQTVGRVFDTNIETFRQLSAVGANFGQSIVDLRLAAAEAALPIDDFAKLIGQNSESLAALFGSTTQGARGIAELGRQVREVGINRLAPLGFTIDEINEVLLLNLDSQRRTGILNNLTDTQRRDSAINFAEQLDRLAKLTGQQREELRRQIEQQRANERFQAFLQGATDETRQRLQAFAGTIAGISPDLAEGFQDLIANAGVPVTESALALVQNIPGARQVVNDLISGVVTSENALVRIRDLSAGSVDRFRKATVTGQVEFLRLQGGIIELGRRITDTGSVFEEQAKTGTDLVKGLTTFEQASKVLSSQFQQIETGLLQAFGPALGGIINSVQSLFGGAGSIATTLAKAPVLTATLFAGALTGKFLFNKAAQIGIIAAGTRLGTAHILPGGGTAGALAKGGAKFAGKGIGAAAGLGLGIGGVAQAGSAETTGGKALGVAQGAAGGALTGAMIGSMIPIVGTAIGAAVGGLIGGGSALFAASQNKRALGTSGATGQLFEPATSILQVEKGERVLNQAETRAVNNFSTVELENKMTTMVTELTNANKTLTGVVNGVNTLVAVEGQALKAVEITARKDRNQVGLV